MNKEEGKSEIKKLVEKYQRLAEADEIKSYNEAQTRNEFIEPLFEFLGWDMRNTKTDKEVTTEESVSGGRVDLAFRLNDIPVMFLEAKAMRVDLDIETYSRQAINYAWNKGVAYAILTDFESIKLYNAQAESKLLADKLIFEISWKDYINDFDRVWLLSKESLLAGALDEYAQKYGKMKKHLTVNEKLFGDLKEAREILMKAFRWDKELTDEELEEGVQRILDRLVFIRVLEDRKLESPILKEVLRTWEQKKSQQFFPLLTKKFRELDDLYDSSLFKEHACEKWEEYTDDAFKKVIHLLYGTEMYVYDFKEIPADILGGVYESYLGYISKRKGETKKELKAEGRKKRKEQGIFYTPHYIVDFIVKETLGEKLKDIKSINELNKIKILDPACGSGSFLVRALRTMNEKYKEFGGPGNVNTKSTILTSNIYGVDLDKQAIELAKLNLLIEALDKKVKLPDITPHIREGNSLISGDAEKLEKYFGENWREQKPFDFQDEFSDVFKQGGFDVIIGNPPYVDVRKIDQKTKSYLFNHFSTAKNRANLFSIFIERGLSLLKDDGCLGFIIPDTILTHSSFSELRREIVNSYKIIKIANLGSNVFKDAQVDTIILILQKNNKNKNHQVEIFKREASLLTRAYNIVQGDLQKDKEHRFILAEPKLNNLLKLIEKDKDNLGDFYHGFNGINPGNQRNKVVTKSPPKDDERYKKVIDGKNVSRYSITWGGEWVLYDKKILERARDENIFLTKPKIILQKIGTGLAAGLDDKQLYTLINTTILIQQEKKYNPLFILALLNSKLLNFYYKNKFLGIQIKTEFLEKIPIPDVGQAEQEKIAKKAQVMLDLHKELQATSANTDKNESLKREIEKIDHEIDQEVYKLYGLTVEEIKIIENN